MSDRRRRFAFAIAAAIALMGALSPALGAQRPTQYDALRDYWAARSARAAARLKEFRHAVDSANSDTTHAVRLDIVSAPELSALSGEVARMADSALQRLWLPPLNSRRAQFELRRAAEQRNSDADDALTAPPSTRTVRLAAREPDGSIKDLTISDSSHAAVDAARMALRKAVVNPSVDALSRDLRDWMVHRPAAELPAPRDWREAWLQLATYPSLPARGCLVGELRACETALALTDERAPLQAFYDASLRQALAARWLKSNRADAVTETQITAVRACAGGGDDAACLRFLGDRSVGFSMVEPGPAQMRTLLVRFAFSFPADSAARADAAYAPGLSIRTRLERASGLPFQELLRRFHDQLAERRPPPLAPSSALLWSASLCFLAFGAVSLGSSRWRG
ncbi:MAG: hypothetical protein AABZ29_09510 [Gemmatimonadota bacterium]